MKALGGSSFKYRVHIFWERRLSWYSSPHNSESVWNTMYHGDRQRWLLHIFFQKYMWKAWWQNGPRLRFDQTEINQISDCHVCSNKRHPFAFRLWRGEEVPSPSLKYLEPPQTSENLVVFDNGRVFAYFRKQLLWSENRISGMDHWSDLVVFMRDQWLRGRWTHFDEDTTVDGWNPAPLDR